MIDLKQFDTENDKQLYEVVVAFNTLYKSRPQTITQYSYYQLWELSDRSIPIAVWKEFYNDPRVQRWYDDELEMALSANLQKLATEAGNNKSSATLQALTAILKHRETKTADTPESNTVFIFSHVPLTTVEENLENAKILRARPQAFDSAIKVSQGDQDPE